LVWLLRRRNRYSQDGDHKRGTICAAGRFLTIGAANDGIKRVSIYAQVSDLQATLDKVEKLGGKTILAPTEVPGGLSWPCSRIQPAPDLYWGKRS
jgi:predicted enzyme related to lactoylglutathione lyase